MKLSINRYRLGIDKDTAKLIAPEVSDFQNAGEIDFNQPVKIPGGKGLLLILK